MKKLLFTLLSAVALTANAQTVTDRYGIEYSINQTAGTATITDVNNYANLMSAVNLVIDSVAYNGKNYPVTEMGDFCFHNGSGGSNFFLAVKTMSFPNLQTMGDECFHNGGGGSNFFLALESISFPNLQTMGNECFFNTSGSSHMFTAATNVSMPNLQTMGDMCFHSRSRDFMTVLEVLEFPSLQTMGDRCVYGAHGNLSVIRLPLSVQMGRGCISGLIGRPHVYPYETGSVRKAVESLEYEENFENTYARIHAPEGMAALMMDHWKVAETTEIYSPVKVSKTNSNYNSYSIRTTDAHASYTQDGTAYVNHYNFNFALDKAACEAPLPAGYTTFTQTADYHYNWYVATGYSDVSKREGKLTIQTPEMSRFTRPVTDSIGVRYYPQGVAPGEGFLLKGPANTDTLYVPIHYANQAYADGNYFRAGTGAAVAKESGGYRNFYYTDPTGFWECANTVIPTNRAYLALPAGMTANGKQISFVIDDGETTGIVNITGTTANGESDTWYTINGTRLNAKPTTKGIYIHNGRKEVIR